MYLRPSLPEHLNQVTLLRRRQRALTQISAVAGIRPYEYTILECAEIGNEPGRTHNHPRPDKCTELQWQQARELIYNPDQKPAYQIPFSPHFSIIIVFRRKCAKPAFRKMSIICVLVALLTWIQDKILNLRFTYFLSNILCMLFLHLHFPLKSWPQQVCAINYLLKSLAPSALISEYKHERA